MKNRPASSRPRPSEPSTKLKPRRRMAVPEFCGWARKTCEVSGIANSPSVRVLKSTGVEFRPLTQRRSRAPGPADRALLVVQRRGVPGLDGHPDAAGDEVGPAGQPVGAAVAVPDPDEPLEPLLVLCLEVVRPVLEAEQVPRRRLAA